MLRKLPGTTVEMAVKNAAGASEVLDNIFMAGGLVLSQVSGLTGLEPYMIQNWVKRGFLPPPVRKMYSKRQFCRIAIINMLRDVMQIEKITGLLSYINGRLDDIGDDIIDDSELYVYYIDAACRYENSKGAGSVEEKVASAVEAAAKGFKEPFPGAKMRLCKVLAAMVYARCAAEMRDRAEEVINTLD
ncbi:MAG: DUF1836 domain-containing protein [Clostridia bacterium]|nr:DUF1836 domain-containing protein [Clostridia bacterium]